MLSATTTTTTTTSSTTKPSHKAKDDPSNTLGNTTQTSCSMRIQTKLEPSPQRSQDNKGHNLPRSGSEPHKDRRCHMP